MPAGSIDGQIVDVIRGEIFPGRIDFSNGTIIEISESNSAPERFLIPGLIDSHVHIESSHLCPSRFAEAVVPHGTTAVVSDPHEIANVFGIDGIRFMIADSKRAPLRCYFTAPSSVPATSFETSGAEIDHEDVLEMMSWPEIVALGEIMNFPGVIAGDEEVFLKIRAAREHRKPIDGHAPLLLGDDLKRYASAGITTDHECTSASEAEEKFKAGLTVQVRQGTACKNLPALAEFAKRHPFMLVSDDRSAHDLLEGHMDMTLREAFGLGIDPIEALRAVTSRPAEHYGLPGGWFEVGRAADIAVVDNLRNFRPLETWIAGVLAARGGVSEFSVVPEKLQTALPRIRKSGEDFSLPSDGRRANVRVISVIRDEIVTESDSAWLEVEEGRIMPDENRDIIRLSVVNRYKDAPVSNSFATGFGLKEGAMASTVAHDSHNCVVIGIDEKDMAEAANTSLERGGFTVTGKGRISTLSLPIGGLMTDRPATEVAEEISELLIYSRELGCSLPNPFMTLSFMSLLVIPKLKLGDRGLFDVDRFAFVSPVIETSHERPD